LVPEYLLRFTGFDKKNQLCIGQIVLSDSYAFVRVIYENRSNLVVIDLENNRPLVHLRQLFGQELTEEIIPKPLKGDVYYSILRGEYGVEEKNPLIVFYRIVSQD
jgi:hypothetical protein